jgi:glucosamine-phosphate N-acetyltransferase
MNMNNSDIFPYNANIQSIILHKDKREEIFALLSQLTSASCIDDARFNHILGMLSFNHNIYVYLENEKIIGMITIFFEQKLIHNGGCVAHIEDLVIDKEHRSKGIADKLIKFCLSKIRPYTCYKVILNCKKELIPFYEKNDFKEYNVQMSKYFD